MSQTGHKAHLQHGAWPPNLMWVYSLLALILRRMFRIFLFKWCFIKLLQLRFTPFTQTNMRWNVLLVANLGQRDQDFDFE